MCSTVHVHTARGARGWRDNTGERRAEGVESWLAGNDLTDTLIKLKLSVDPPSPRSDKVTVHTCRCTFHNTHACVCVLHIYRHDAWNLHLRVHLGPSCLFWTCWQRSPQALWSGEPGAAAEPLLSCMCLRSIDMWFNGVQLCLTMLGELNTLR